MFKRRKKTFKWQINASAVGKLLGYFGRERRDQAIAECWQMNVKRMHRFGVTPAEPLTQKPVAEVVQQQLEQKPVYKELVAHAIVSNREQVAVVQQIKAVAAKDVQQAKRKYEEIVSKAKTISACQELPEYPSKKSGTKRAAINSFFMSKGKVYHKTSRQSAKISNISLAKEHGWRPAAEIKQASQAVQKEIVSKKADVDHAQTIGRHVEKQAMKAINTTRGIRKEASDLELVQKRFPGCLAGNDKAYFMHISGSKWPGFVIGRIDGITPGVMIFELKHRQARLFHEFRRYEQVQCMLYMKMVKISRCMLVETFEGEQVYYDASMDSEGRMSYRKEGDPDTTMSILWTDIKRGIEGVVQLLNKAEDDAEYREELKSKLY
jgi:hypothetical protein